jgi:hypothetical protein
VSDYVLRTRLALRDDDWKENEELIWLKPDAPPLGSKQRPRRTWEQVLWFSKTPKPFVNLYANGGFSDRIGFVGSHRFRNQQNPIVTKRSSSLRNGQTRTPDHFTALVADIERGIMHPAMFPVSLCDKLIRTFSREGDLVCDPFCGSGTTLVAAQELNRRIIGFDVNPKYVEMAKARLNKKPDGSLVADAASGSGFRLRPEFPQRPSVRRAFLLSKGLNASDVRVFNLVLDRTVNTKDRVASVALSLTDVAELTSFSRRTVIRSLDRLRDAKLVATQRDDESHRHRSSLIGLSPDLLMPVVVDRTGDINSRKVTRSIRDHQRTLRRQKVG